MKCVPLVEVCQIFMGQAPDGASYNEEGNGYPLIAGAGDFGYRTPNPKKFTTQPSRISAPDDIILCVRATIGDLNWSDKAYCLGRGVAGLRTKQEQLDRRYLWHFINANKQELAALGTGSTFKQISRNDIETFEIPLPPLGEQRHIATILDKADEIHRKRLKSIRLTEDFLRSTFLEMFGDPVTNPKGWKVEPLEKLVNFTTGKLDSNAAVKGGAYPFFTCSREDFQIDSYSFDCEALLLAGNNASADYSVKYYKGKFNVYQRTYVITMAIPDLSYRYMQYAFEMKLQDMKRLSKGTNTKYLTLSILKQLEFQVPDKGAQEKFDIIIERIVRNTLQQNKALRLSELNFKSLVQRAFRGEL